MKKYGKYGWMVLGIYFLVSLISSPSFGQKLPAERKIPPIEILAPTPEYDPARFEATLMMVEEWKKLGFDIDLKPVTASVTIDRMIKSRNYQTGWMGWSPRIERIDPHHFCYSLLHSKFAVGGQENCANYMNPEYDKLAEEQMREMDAEKRKKVVFKCQEIFARDVPAYCMFGREKLVAYNKDDFGSVLVMMGEGLNSYWTFINIKPIGKNKFVRWGTTNEVRSLNPLQVTFYHDFEVLRLIYDRLVEISPEGSVVPRAATEIKLIDPTTVRVQLRSGMKFHDGNPVTVEDVKFTFEYLDQWKAKYFNPLLEAIKSIEILDKSTMQFKLKEPFAPFLSNTLSQVFILPKHIWKDIPQKVGLKTAEEWLNLHPIGSGPFKFEYWRRNEEMKLAKFDGHFHQPKVDGIIKLLFADMEGLVGALEKKELDLDGSLGGVSPVAAERLKKFKHVEIGKSTPISTWWFYFRNDLKPFNDINLRRALVYAIPKEKIVNQILEGHGVVPHSFIPPINKFWYNPNVIKYPYNLEKARQILKEARYEWDSEGKIYYPGR